jgi:hypothetical protein
MLLPPNNQPISGICTTVCPGMLFSLLQRVAFFLAHHTVVLDVFNVMIYLIIISRSSDMVLNLKGACEFRCQTRQGPSVSARVIGLDAVGSAAVILFILVCNDNY